MDYSLSRSLIFFIALSFISCENESSENQNSEGSKNSKLKDGGEVKATGNSAVESPHVNRQILQFLIRPDDTFILNPKYENNPRPEPGFTNGNQNLFLVDDTGRYNVQLRNVERPKPANLNAALGAISAHILNQKNNQEYIPYPPNGDPYNYPAYHGYPHGTEPPVIRSYETTSNANYGIQPSVNFDQYGSRRVFLNNAYQQGFPNQFDNFNLGYYDPNYFNRNAFYPALRRSGNPEKLQDYQTSGDQWGNNFQRSVERIA